MDISNFPTEVLHLITAVKGIKTKHDLNNIVMIGDLYVPLAYRGKGYARQLLEDTCTHLFSQGIKTVVLIPDPFEYKDDKQILLNNEDKKQKLIKLYYSCGFKKDSEDAALYMYRDAKSS